MEEGSGREGEVEDGERQGSYNMNRRNGKKTRTSSAEHADSGQKSNDTEWERYQYTVIRA